MLLVDEAHSLGVTGTGDFQGRGSVAGTALAGHPNVIVTATLSKALGSQGGAVLGSSLLREHLVNRARELHFRHRTGAGLRSGGPRRGADHPRRTLAGADAVRTQRCGACRRAAPLPWRGPRGRRSSGPREPSSPSPCRPPHRPVAAARPRACRGRPGRLLPPAVRPRRDFAASAHRPRHPDTRATSKTAAQCCAAFWRNFHEPARASSWSPERTPASARPSRRRPSPPSSRQTGRSVAVYKPCQSGAAAGDSDAAEIIRLAGP